VAPKGQGRDPEIFEALGGLSITVLDRRIVTMDHLLESTYGESYGHVTDDVT